jgi:NTE family protein
MSATFDTTAAGYVTRQPEIVELVRNLRQECAGKVFSDVVDDEGHQYVDLVMEGGGVLGLALAGYTYLLEEMGIRFLRIGGTSVGSINALFLASLGPPAEAKSEKVIAEMISLDMLSVLDGDDDALEFVEAVVEKRNWLTTAVAFLQAWDTVRDDLGLVPGERFVGWLASVLGRGGINTYRQLEARLRELPEGLRLRDGRLLTVEEARPALAVVATDVTTQSKVELPRMASLYWHDPDAVNPALFTRASLSIPFFFQPFKKADIPQGPEAEERWRRFVGYYGPVPTECALVDGGIVSNFPIGLFHQPRTVPHAPTFGVKFHAVRHQQVDEPLSLFGAVFNAARRCLDFDFITRNPDYRKLVSYIEPGPHYWLDFGMGKEERRDLFLRGARAAASFLVDFDWDNYKHMRSKALS